MLVVALVDFFDQLFGTLQVLLVLFLDYLLTFSKSSPSFTSPSANASTVL